MTLSQPNQYDTELFELCRDVFIRTGWTQDKGTGRSFNPAAKIIVFGWMEGNIPLYTSDYLLEKLPRFIEGYLITDEKLGSKRKAKYQSKNLYFSLEPSNEGWMASYDDLNGFSKINAMSDTPLKALLKLVIALDDAGELTHA